MFGKLLKHEFRATGRIMLPLLGAILILSPMAGLVLRAIDRNIINSFLRFFSILFIIIFFVAVAAIFVTAFIIMIRRFYSNMLGDEGYLTFTLPVSIHALVFSKLLVSFVWFLTSGIIAFVSGVIVTAINYSGSDFSVMWKSVKDVFTLVGTGNAIIYFAELLIMLFLMSCSICLHFYASMALGNCFANKKIFLSICFFVLLSIVMGWIQFAVISAFGNESMLFTVNRLYDSWADGLTTAEAYALIPHAMLLSGCVYFLFVSAVYYIPTFLPFKKKLNLS